MSNSRPALDQILRELWAVRKSIAKSRKWID